MTAINTPSRHKFYAQITHCAIAPGRGSFGEDINVRITGFYKIGYRTSTNRVLLRCLPDDPGLAVIGSSSLCGLFHRPWELIWERFVPWSDDIIADAQSSWERRVGEGDDIVHGITSNSYPQIHARYPDMSAHEHIAIEKWRAETSDRIQSAMEDIAA